MGWSVVSLLGGPAGLAVLAGVEIVRGKEECNACGKERWIGPQACVCGAVLSADVADGREIFEPAEVFAGTA